MQHATSEQMCIIPAMVWYYKGNNSICTQNSDICTRISKKWCNSCTSSCKVVEIVFTFGQKFLKFLSSKRIIWAKFLPKILGVKYPQKCTFERNVVLTTVKQGSRDICALLCVSKV